MWLAASRDNTDRRHTGLQQLSLPTISYLSKDWFLHDVTKPTIQRNHRTMQPFSVKHTVNVSSLRAYWVSDSLKFPFHAKASCVFLWHNPAACWTQRLLFQLRALQLAYKHITVWNNEVTLRSSFSRLLNTPHWITGIVHLVTLSF